MYMYVYIFVCVFVCLCVSHAATQDADEKNKVLTGCYPWGKVYQWIRAIEIRQKCQGDVTNLKIAISTVFFLSTSKINHIGA